MKKIVTITVLLFFILTFLPISKESQAVTEYQVIPDEAIRLRILANSDEEEDQALKIAIRDEVNREITNWVADLTDIDEARALIEARLPEIEQVAAQTLKDYGVDQSLEVEYGSSIAFPAKVYDTYVYPQGEYEAILISLGEAKGSNWWCVLFPPLCFLDFSAGTTVASHDNDQAEGIGEEEEQEADDVEVRFFFLEWFR